MKKLLYNPFTAIILLFMSISIVFSLRKNKKSLELAQKESDYLQQEAHKLKSELEKEKEAIELSDATISQEKIIRNELLMKKKGEVVIKIPPISVTPFPKKITPTQTPRQAWKDLFFE